MQNNPIRVGGVGVGGIFTGVHMPNMLKSSDMVLTAVCDNDPEKLFRVRELYGISEDRCFADFRDLVNCPDVDAVDICTSNDVHHPVAMAAIEAGKPYLLEKPVALNATLAEEMALRTDEKKLANMVCFSYRFRPAARFARDLVLQGAIGDVHHVYMQYLFGFASNRSLAWRCIKERAGSGLVSDLGSHSIDLARFITGREFVRVAGHLGTCVKEARYPDGSGWGEVETDDYANILAEMDGGTSVSYQITANARGRFNYQRMDILGSKGAIIYSQNTGERRRDATNGFDDTDKIEVSIGEPYMSTFTYSELPVPQQYFSNQMQSFADIVNNCGDGLAASIEDGFIAQKVIDKIIEADAGRMWLDI